MDQFLKNYFNDYTKLLSLDKELESYLLKFKDMVLQCSKNRGTSFFIGNGGSAATSSHIAVDLSKNAKVKALNFNDADLITCFANDFGHDHWMKEAIKIYSNKNDLIVLISASGNSKNILNAAEYCVKNSIPLVTFSGMSKDNNLKKINNNGLNFWVDSKAYNHIEMVHHFLLVCLVDMIIGKTVYSSDPNLI
jgi:D-sedoheptulose 7-phosphate isomerase